MKHTISNLAKFAREVSEKKFQKLSSKKQHELLGSLAFESIENDGYNNFLIIYERLHGWAELDRFCPPFWLNSKEKLMGYYNFHMAYSPNPPQTKIKNTDQTLNLQRTDVFDVSIFLDEIRSPYNIGSILRIADNFRIKEVVHSSKHIDINNPRLKKASMGSYRWIPLRYEQDPVSWMKNSGKEIIGLEKNNKSIPLYSWNPSNSCIIIAGNEENGISEKMLSLCSEVVEIPIFGFKKSMNVNNAVSIICSKYCEVHCDIIK